MTDWMIAILIISGLWSIQIVASHLIRKRMAEDRLDRMLAGLEEMVERRKEAQS